MRNVMGISAALVLAATGTAVAAPFSLTSTSFKPNAALTDKQVANTFGCTGGNVSPALEWKNPPAGTKSFAVMVHDPDAPTGGAGFWHWIVFNIPADTTSLAEGAGAAAGTALPKGAVQWRNDMSLPGWAGPCPPPGTKHRYNFTVYPLKVDKLEIPPGASIAVVGFNINMNAIGKPAKLTAVYARPKEPAAPKAAEPVTPDTAKPAAPSAPVPTAPKPAAPAPK